MFTTTVSQYPEQRYATFFVPGQVKQISSSDGAHTVIEFLSRNSYQ
jgi:hypothetical protein